MNDRSIIAVAFARILSERYKHRSDILIKLRNDHLYWQNPTIIIKMDDVAMIDKVSTNQEKSSIFSYNTVFASFLDDSVHLYIHTTYPRIPRIFEYDNPTVFDKILENIDRFVRY